MLQPRPPGHSGCKDTQLQLRASRCRTLTCPAVLPCVVHHELQNAQCSMLLQKEAADLGSRADGELESVMSELARVHGLVESFQAQIREVRCVKCACCRQAAAACCAPAMGRAHSHAPLRACTH
jgi:hypothetical protein